jgi:hypothetical protein
MIMEIKIISSSLDQKMLTPSQSDCRLGLQLSASQ